MVIEYDSDVLSDQVSQKDAASPKSQIQISQPRSSVLEILEKEQFELKEIFTLLMKYN